jgi:CheY-like chemotaxis protein
MTKILLVEDDKSLREIYGVRLLAEGYDIVSAGDGEEALTVAIREKPALIISDVMMPKISGFEMLDLLRSNDATKSIKVIMMTALSGEQHRERSESLGADRYLIKSQIGIEDVVNTVHEVLGDRVAAAQPANATPSAPTPAQVTPAPVAPQAPAMSAPNQSPVNPPAATTPNTVAGVPAPILPATPPNIPVVTTPNVPIPPSPVPAQQAPAVAPAPVTAAPTPTPNMPDLPPLPPPTAPQAPPVSAPPVVVPSFQPKQPTEAEEEQNEQAAVPNTPAVDLTQSGGHIGTRVIQPTGETLTPQVDMENLIANEDAKDIMGQPASPDFQSQVAEQPAPTAAPAPEIQIDSSGAINIDNLPAGPVVDPATTFPNQQ